MGYRSTGPNISIAALHRLHHIEVILHVVNGAVFGKPIEQRPNPILRRHGSFRIRAHQSEHNLRFKILMVQQARQYDFGFVND